MRGRLQPGGGAHPGRASGKQSRRVSPVAALLVSLVLAYFTEERRMHSMDGVLYEDLLARDGGGRGYVMTAGWRLEGKRIGMFWGGGDYLAPFPM